MLFLIVSPELDCDFSSDNSCHFGIQYNTGLDIRLLSDTTCPFERFSLAGAQKRRTGYIKFSLNTNTIDQFWTSSRSKYASI